MKGSIFVFVLKSPFSLSYKTPSSHNNRKYSVSHLASSSFLFATSSSSSSFVVIVIVVQSNVSLSTDTKPCKISLFHLLEGLKSNKFRFLFFYFYYFHFIWIGLVWSMHQSFVHQMTTIYRHSVWSKWMLAINSKSKWYAWIGWYWNISICNTCVVSNLCGFYCIRCGSQPIYSQQFEKIFQIRILSFLTQNWIVLFVFL